MFYYLNQIKIYKSTMGFVTIIEKAMHINQIKDFIKRTNMNKGYEKQILDHNIEMFNLIIKANLKMFFLIKIFPNTNQNIQLQINLVRDAKKIIKNSKYHFEKNNSQKLQYSSLIINYQCLAEIVADKSKILR